MRCLDSLPVTNFCLQPGNPVEKIFWGRLNIEAGSAQFYFTKRSIMQRLLHQLKYSNNKDIGLQMGRIMGEQLADSERFACDAVVPLPLFPAREKRRGYNQARIICNGISGPLNIPVLDKAVARMQFTASQTKKGRIERWKNVEGKFSVTDPSPLEGRHLLLVDDVVTTGATLEHCAAELLKVPGVKVSIATLCIAK